jgi:NAD dependent epimerase/dehydratase family enzyme
MLPILGSGAGVWSWIHVDDAAASTVAALAHGSRGIYNIVDDEPAKVSDWMPYITQAIGAKPPLRVPAWLGRLLAGEVAVQWMTEGRGASNAKAKTRAGPAARLADMARRVPARPVSLEADVITALQFSGPSRLH